MLRIVQSKNENFQIKILRRGGSSEYPQSMLFLAKYDNYVHLSKPQFYYIRVGFKGVKIIQACFRDATKHAYIILTSLI